MTSGNFALMQKHYKRPFKCIVLLRDLMDVLASYMQWYTENPDAFPNRYNLNTDEEKLAMIMNKDGAVAKDLEAIRAAVALKEGGRVNLAESFPGTVGEAAETQKTPTANVDRLDFNALRTRLPKEISDDIIRLL